MELKCFNALPKEAEDIRRAVFMEEQGFQEEFDETDAYAKHLVLFEKEQPIATCRLFPKPGTPDYVIGRIAVMKQYRGQSIGAGLLKAAEKIAKDAGGVRTLLHAQVRVRRFYEKQGYQPCSEIEPEEGCPHIWMCKSI